MENNNVELRNSYNSLTVSYSNLFNLVSGMEDCSEKNKMIQTLHIMRLALDNLQICLVSYSK